jgi:hypothetical protein
MNMMRSFQFDSRYLRVYQCSSAKQAFVLVQGYLGIVPGIKMFVRGPIPEGLVCSHRIVEDLPLREVAWTFGRSRSPSSHSQTSHGRPRSGEAVSNSAMNDDPPSTWIARTTALRRYRYAWWRPNTNGLM